MSPNVSSFVGDLVEMAKAFEELPEVKEHLNIAVRLNEQQAITIGDREDSILKLKAEIETLHAKVRTTEVERDDAEMRFLELDEKAHKALAALGNIMANVNDAT